ncbi:MAG TPA: GNAT family N-acetyltransferase, partial [Vicinamibacterales bacterium]|nr:GNAT family N-acetyltransferase [Vicinamibacterales bacterium]
MTTPISVRAARTSDVDAMMRLLVAAAEDQGEPGSLCVTAADLLREGFGERPTYHALLAEASGRIVGLALYSFNFSTWRSVNGLHLEDLFVDHTWRRRGVARALMHELTDVARAHKCGRFSWFVLKGNDAARRFYASLGATTIDDWMLMQI